MLEYAFVGLIAASIVTLSKYLFFIFPQIVWFPTFCIVGVALLKLALQKKAHYDGIADFFGQIHYPTGPESSKTWFLHGMISFILIFFGGCAGSEGAGIEISYAILLKFRAYSVRWFEQKRRTDAAMSLSAGISAAFGAPFAGTLLPIELGIGGKNLGSAFSALFAFLTVQFLSHLLGIQTFDLKDIVFSFDFKDWQMIQVFICIGVVCGVLGVSTIYLIHYFQKELVALFKGWNWIRIFFASFLLFFVFYIYHPSYVPPWVLIKQIILAKHSVNEIALLFCIRAFVLILIFSGIGTLGIFWPVFALGGLLGSGVLQCFHADLGHFTSTAAIIGSAAFFGVIFRAPLTGTVLVFEITQSVESLFPVFCVSIISVGIAKLFKTPSLIDKGLESLGISLLEGRATSILNSVLVKDAMIKDFDTIDQHESAFDLYHKRNEFKYPFIPVVDAQGGFVGLLTLDLIVQGWQAQPQKPSQVPLSNLLEAKDLLYRSKVRTPTIQMNDKLSVTRGLFDISPCLPVLTDGRKIAGLLFTYNVRSAYERETLRHTFDQTSFKVI